MLNAHRDRKIVLRLINIKINIKKLNILKPPLLSQIIELLKGFCYSRQYMRCCHYFNSLNICFCGFKKDCCTLQQLFYCLLEYRTLDIFNKNTNIKRGFLGTKNAFINITIQISTICLIKKKKLNQNDNRVLINLSFTFLLTGIEY